MKHLVQACKALSDPNRIRILKMLETRTLCLCEVRDVLKLANSTVSRHLVILRDAGFIVDNKEGKWVNYSLNHERSNEYTRHLLPLIRTWLPADATIQADREQVLAIDRYTICNT